MPELSKSVMGERASTLTPIRPAPAGAQEVEGISLGDGNILSIGRGQSVIGKARVVKDPEHPGDFSQGDILVAENTDPNYTPLFRIAGGVITNNGGITSHASITAREFRIPGAQLTDATKKIQNGDLIALDLSPIRKGQRIVRIVKVSP